jgi:hypothetical protein
MRKLFPNDGENNLSMYKANINILEDTDHVLLKTIKITKNLFSLTERLPKPKYRKNANYTTL